MKYKKFFVKIIIFILCLLFFLFIYHKINEQNREPFLLNSCPAILLRKGNNLYSPNLDLETDVNPKYINSVDDYKDMIKLLKIKTGCTVSYSQTLDYGESFHDKTEEEIYTHFKDKPKEDYNKLTK